MGGPSGEALVAAANAYEGVPYLYGGKTPAGLDCSGLIRLSLADLGIPFVHGSSAQIDACIPIDVETAWNTPGALLWRDGHDAISTGQRGDEATVEAVVPAVALLAHSDTYDGGQVRFTRGGLIPGIDYSTPPGSDMATSPAKGYISSVFGPRRALGFHAGVDIAGSGSVSAPADMTIVRIVRGRTHGQPATSGTVLAPGRSGNGLVGRLATGVHVLMGHVAVKPSLKVGQKIKQGTILGDRDLSGITTGPHCHFETWRNASPSSYFDPRQWATSTGVTLGAQPSAPPALRYPDVGVTPSTPLGDLLTATAVMLQHYGHPDTGTSGDSRVRRIQNWLNDTWGERLLVDGDFGTKTKAALQRRLARNDRKPYKGPIDGKFGNPGSASRTALAALLNDRRSAVKKG